LPYINKYFVSEERPELFCELIFIQFEAISPLVKFNKRSYLTLPRLAYLDDVVVIQNALDIVSILIEYFIDSDQMTEQSLIV
jgi:hypothetical protein